MMHRQRKSVEERSHRLTVSVAPEDARALALEADANGRSVASEMRMALKAWLKAKGRRV